MLVDSTGSGVYDKATIYADNLVLPRMVLPLDDRVVIAETYTGKFVSYRDTDGDGIADEHVQVYDGGRSNANLEHQDSALLYGTDNYVYSAQTGSRRFRIGADLMWTAEPIYGIGSQWGLAMDDLGRLYSSTAGGERPAFGFQQHPSYGALSLPGETADDFSEIFPRMQTVDVQGGLGRVHPIKGTLNHITGCAGQSIYRGDRLPADLYGDYLLPEPVGRLIRRARCRSSRASACWSMPIPAANSSPPPTWPSARYGPRPARTAASTSSTCTTASSRRGHGPVPAPTCAASCCATASMPISAMAASTAWSRPAQPGSQAGNAA